MRKTVLRNKGGFGLVEVLVAFVVLLFASLALMQTALMSIDSNTVDLLRDEAVRVAGAAMNETRNIRYDDNADALGTGTVRTTVRRNVRSMADFPFTVARTCTDVLQNDAKQITITVTWEWKEKTAASGDPYVHSITTIRRREHGG
ncbi:MAG: type II secretion system GspH family protein [Nitrospirae bacterium]|nr:type II secretion system GspH family protein [Nitrospirota bacterium]